MERGGLLRSRACLCTCCGPLGRGYGPVGPGQLFIQGALKCVSRHTLCLKTLSDLRFSSDGRVYGLGMTPRLRGLTALMVRSRPYEFFPWGPLWDPVLSRNAWFP